jgi:hypothetical protein
LLPKVRRRGTPTSSTSTASSSATGNRRADAPVLPLAGNWHGTTIRAYDPALDAWRIFWIDPATNSFARRTRA